MASIELIRLLAELKKAASPVQRMKLVARAWRSVRRLAPSERRDLAAEVGLEGAEELLERLASRGGSRLSPSLLLRALDRIRETEPRQIRAVVDTMRDPSRRSEMMQRAVEALAPETEPGPEPEPEPEPESPPRPEPEVPKAIVEPAPVDPPTPIVTPPAPAPAVIPQPVSDGGLTDRIAGAESVTARFRLLRSGVESLRVLQPEQLGRLLERFPSGWQRRRALATLFRSRIPESAQQALELIEHLESERAQRWCASILLDRWPLSAQDRDALVERHGLFRRGLC